MFTSLNIFVRITSFLTQGLEKETVNHLCCYNETNDNKSQVIQISLLYFMADFFIGVMREIFVFSQLYFSDVLRLVLNVIV